MCKTDTVMRHTTVCKVKKTTTQTVDTTGLSGAVGTCSLTSPMSLDVFPKYHACVYIVMAEKTIKQLVCSMYLSTLL